jgi:periplasmic copper chaperone A
MTITNKGSAPDRLIAASISAAGRVEIHETAMKDGCHDQRPAVEPGKTVTLAPGGHHIVFMGLKAPLRKQGEKLPVTLEFEKAGNRISAISSSRSVTERRRGSRALYSGGSCQWSLLP